MSTILKVVSSSPRLTCGVTAVTPHYSPFGMVNNNSSAISPALFDDGEMDIKL
jgi:hypothetical protein